MIDFQRVHFSHKEPYEAVLMAGPERGCEYTFANLYLWDLHNLAFRHGCIVRFSHFYGRNVYPYPMGNGNKKAVIAEILQDAAERGIPCCITGMTQQDKEELEQLFPGRFYIKADRDVFDYVYDINDLADLRGRKFQGKRNHFNRFCAEHPDHQVVPMAPNLLPQVKKFVKDWYSRCLESDPMGDYILESVALARMFNHYGELDMEGLVLMDGNEILAITMGSRLSPDTFDVHFEKAREDVSGAYNAINCHFARHLRLQHPELRYLNREDDMGLEGLRNAKLSYRPHHLIEKYRARPVEDFHVD